MGAMCICNATSETLWQVSTPVQQSSESRSWLDRTFKITERGSSVSREIRGGLVTFFAMSYILILNPIILGYTQDGTGMYLAGLEGGTAPNLAAVAAGTALVAGLMTILMGAVANFPLALAAGLGLNAVVAYSVAALPGMTWQAAMGIVVLEGLIILILVLTGFREAVFKAVPRQLKTAISVGIGLFIALIGLVDAGVVRRGGGTPLQLGANNSFGTLPVAVFVVVFLLMAVLMVKKVRGAILISIAVGAVLAVITEAIFHLGERSDENPGGWGLAVPAVPDSLVQSPDFSTLGQVDLFGAFSKIGIVAAALLVFSLLLADFFDTMGTMVAVGAEAELLDEEGNPPNTSKILIVDSVAAAAGGLGGVSSNTSYIESSAGVGDGARTGLASIVTGCMFLLSIFFAPLVAMVPYEAATPALVIVGFLMMMQVTEISWKDWEIAIPAFLTMIMMPFTYSITVGIGAGFVTWVVIQIAVGKIKKIHWLMWVTAFLFILYFTMQPIQDLLGIG